jgi:hypothetical protein
MSEKSSTPLENLVREATDDGLFCCILDFLHLHPEEKQEGKDDILHLNIGGKYADVKRSSLTVGFSLFSLLFNKRWEGLLMRDKNNRIYLDMDDEWLMPFLDYYSYSPCLPVCSGIIATTRKNSTAVMFDCIVKFFSLKDLAMEEEPRLVGLMEGFTRQEVSTVLTCLDQVYKSNSSKNDGLYKLVLSCSWKTDKMQSCSHLYFSPGEYAVESDGKLVIVRGDHGEFVTAVSKKPLISHYLQGDPTVGGVLYKKYEPVKTIRVGYGSVPLSHSNLPNLPLFFDDILEVESGCFEVQSSSSPRVRRVKPKTTLMDIYSVTIDKHDTKWHLVSNLSENTVSTAFVCDLAIAFALFLSNMWSLSISVKPESKETSKKLADIIRLLQEIEKQIIQKQKEIEKTGSLISSFKVNAQVIPVLQSTILQYIPDSQPGIRVSGRWEKQANEVDNEGDMIANDYRRQPFLQLISYLRFKKFCEIVGEETKLSLTDFCVANDCNNEYYRNFYDYIAVR